MSNQIYPWRNIPKGRNFIPATECIFKNHDFLWGFDIDQKIPVYCIELEKALISINHFQS